MPTVVLVGTLDTKGQEYAYLADRIREDGVDVILVDAGILGAPLATPDVTREEVAAAVGADVQDLADAGDRGVAVESMGRGAAAIVKRLHAEGKLDAIGGLGGSGGSSIATFAMRQLPIGVPKLMVSTVASGDTSPYVGSVDVTMMYSVVDIAGINRISAQILTNAAAALAGMAKATVPPLGEEKPLITASMFGVTTAAVTTARERLEELGYEVLVFHQTGAGGGSMEALIAAGFITGSLDVTTTEFCDLVAGGVLVAVPERLESAGKLGIPQVVSLGALDMVNFGPLETVPERYRDRNLYVHNPTITLMRTTPDECREIGRIIGDKLNAATGPTVLFMPLRGVSAIATEGQVFHDADADRALFDTIRALVDPAKVEVHEVDADVNDPAFALAMANRLHELIRGGLMTRAEALARLRAQIAAGSPIIGAGAGTGLSAKLAEAGGADLIIIYNSGRFRMGGRGSLSGLMPYGDANEIVVDMAREVLPVVKDTPVLAGVCGTDPFRLMPVFIAELKRMGFSGVQNFPTVGLIDGTFRVNLEETGMGYGLEVDAIRIAHELDLLTAPYVFSDDDATAMAEAGADVLVPHMGLTTGGSIGADTAKTLDDCVPLIQGMHDAAKRVNPDVIVLCHGGPIAEPDDAAYVLERTEGVVGFFGASSMERLPTEVAMTENMKRFKSIPDEEGHRWQDRSSRGASLTRDQHDWGVFAQVSGPRDGLARRSSRSR